MDVTTSLQMLAKKIPLLKKDATLYDYLGENIEQTMLMN